MTFLGASCGEALFRSAVVILGASNALGAGVPANDMMDGVGENVKI